jgi:hypothetical protein
MSGIDLALRQAVDRLRRRRLNRVLLEGAGKVVFAVLLAVLAAVLVTALLGAGSNGVLTARVIGYVVIAAAVVRFLVVPLFRRPTDRQLALYIEEREPALRQALVSAVHEIATPEEQRESPGLSARVVEHALAEIRQLESGPGVERPRMQRAAGLLAGGLAAGALLVLAGPRMVRDAARVLFVPWSEAEAAPVLAIGVTPGNASVPRGGAVQVAATLRGFESDGAELVMRADTASEWIRVPMQRDSAAGTFSVRVFDLVRATEYFVESEGVKSLAYKLTVTDLPGVQKLALTLRYPAYTGLAPETQDPGGDVAALNGTTVTVRSTLTRAAKSAAIRLDDGSVIPMTADSAGRFSGSFRIAKDGFYRVDLVAPDGTPVPGSVQYVIEALEDHRPMVRIEQPGRDTKVTSVEEVTIALAASDDYGVTSLELLYSVNGGPEQRVKVSDSTRRPTPDLRAAHTLFLEELSLKPGDLISYHASAKDGAGNTGSSDIYFLEVRPFGRDYRQAESRGGGGGGGGADSPEGLSARQRDVIAGTFNWLRDSARTAEKQRREDLTTLAISQGRLKQDAEGLVRRLVERNVASSDTNFAKIRDELEAAGKEMQAAEEGLGKGTPREALPAEQRALQHVQRAEAVYREVQIQLGGGGGGGGGGANRSRAEDLADLFELENDKLRNQYESVQRERSQSAQQEIDEIAERLRQLAARQQQENERMQRAADALRNRAGQQGGGGGGGGGQRELARQAEEEARRLERLSREQNNPQLAETARQLREAADAMRRAGSDASGSASQGGNALDRLRRATQNLENAKNSGLAEQFRDLQRRAQELAERQKEIAEGVNGLGGASTAERSEQLRRLDEKKDGLAAEVDKLQSDAERAAREGRREQPGASSRAGQAVEAIQQGRIRDRIVYSKGVMRGNSPDYARRFEEQITDNLGDVAGRLREAAGALGEASDDKRDRALERARDLVRGLESLADRTGQSGQTGQRGQQGQGEAQGGQQEGRQAGQGQGRGQQRGENQGGQGGSQQRGENQGGLGPNPMGGGGNPGPISGEQARQYGREFRMRREAAESLRREVARQGIETAELDRAIRGLRQLETGAPFTDPKAMDELQKSIIEGLKTWEFRLWRALTQGSDKGPAVGSPSQAPAEYRALVEEYYRALAREKKPNERPDQKP